MQIQLISVVVDNLDVVILSALEIDTKFNVNVMSGSDEHCGIIRGISVDTRCRYN